MPLNWNRFRIFYGWWIVAASFIIALFFAGVIYYGFTAIFEPIVKDMQWSYTQVSLAASLRGLEGGLLAPFVGILVDRWGPRRLVFTGAIIIAAGLTLLSYTTSLGMFYGAFFLIALGGSTCTSTVLMATVANWFHGKVGIATGIVASGFGFGGLLIPVIVRLIEMYDWRTTMVIFALATLALVPLLSLVLRHKPEQYGYLPDGRVEGKLTAGSRQGASQAAQVDVKTKQALKSGAFWRIALAFSCTSVILSAVVTHIMPYLSSIGITKLMSSIVATAMPVVSISGRLGLGWVGDKIDRRRVTMVAFIMMALGMLCFGYAASAGAWLLVAFLILFGVGYGGSIVMRPSLLRGYFGRANFGTILGLVMGINILGSVAGPPLAGWVYDNWNSYQGIWFVFAGLPVVALMFVLTIPPVRTTVELTDKA